MTLESIPAYIRRRAAEGASYGDVAHELGGAVYAVRHICESLGVKLKEGMHPAVYDGRVKESASE